MNTSIANINVTASAGTNSATGAYMPVESNQPQIQIPPTNNNQSRIINVNFSANLEDIANQKLIFFDKSDHLLKLFSLDCNRILILRPPLFGKSIICDMIEYLYKGQKSIFQTLNAKISENWDFSKVFPVIRFSMRFNAINFDEFYIQFTEIVKKLYIQFNLSMDIFCDFGIPQDALAYLIQTLINDGQKIVLIIEDIETCLIHMPFKSPHINKIKLCMQQLFNYLINVKDSFEFLFITGIDNFYKLSSLCTDLTESPEVAGLFGITKQDIGQVDFFKYDESNMLEENYISFQFKTIIGSFVQTTYEIFNFLKDEYIETLKYIKYSENGYIKIKNLQSILLFCMGNCFSPYTNVFVSNYIDFLGMCYHSKVEYYWIQSVLRRETEFLSKDFAKIFLFYPNSKNIYEDIIINELFGGYHELNPIFDNYKYLLRFGFFTYAKGKVYPTNMNSLNIMYNAVIDFFKINAGIDLSRWESLSLIDAMKSFKNYYMTTKIPLVLKENKCIETILAIFLTSIYVDSQMKVLANGSLTISSNSKFFKFAEVENIRDYFSFFSKSEGNILISIKASPENADLIVSTFKDDIISSYTFEVPNFYESPLIQSSEVFGKSGFFSFSDAVFSVIFSSCWGKTEWVTKYAISAELAKKMPELSDDRYLDKKVSLALQLLYQNGKIKFDFDPKKKNVYYTIAKNVTLNQNQNK